MNALRTVCAFFLLVHAAPAAPSYNTGAGGGATNDAFDITAGVRVIASSQHYSGFYGAGCCGESDVRAAFGFATSAYNRTSGWVEPPNVIFQDGPPTGTTDFIEWQTPAPINLSAFQMRLQQDGATTARGAGSFKFFASADGINFSQSSAGTMPSAPNPSPYVPMLVADSNLTGTTTNVRAFRLELTRLSANGPRLLEFDGTGSPGVVTGTFLDRIAFNATTNTRGCLRYPRPRRSR